ncbi:MAG TPA: acetylglutamate kinase [Phycisphaerales bacterium]|nr:acetylglutamate kinase [Phycisphaerales bacterium]
MHAAAIEKAVALVEAHRYIQRFRDKVVVVKVGGSVQEDEAALRDLLSDISFMSAVGMRPVIVHGGGKAITAAMERAGLRARFVRGRRYTDRETLEIAERVLVGEINAGMVEFLSSTGSLAIGLHSLASCVIFGERLVARGPASGERLDLGYVGQVTDVNTVLVAALCEDGYIPVIAPVAIARDPGPEGVWKLNVNADDAAGKVAAALQAEKLVMMSDTHGIRTDPADPASYASTLTRSEIDRLIGTGVIGEGMLPKVAACLTALQAGVPKAHIIDGRIPHSVLLEIYTDAGIGTQIVLD